MADGQLIARAGGHTLTAWHGAPVEPTIVHGAGPIEVELRGAGPWTLTIADVLVTTDPVPGGENWSSERLLERVVGPLTLRATQQGQPLVIELDVRPTKLTRTEIAALLEELHDLAADLAGPGVADLRGADAQLTHVEGLLGHLAEAANGIRRKPLHRRLERVRAVAAAEPQLVARDVRWLARHPAQALRATGGTRAAAVLRDPHKDLDVLENRGVISVFNALRSTLSTLESRLHHADADLAARARALRHAPAAPDAPDPEALYRADQRLRQRRQRAAQLRDEIDRLRARTGLPPTLPGLPSMPRTHQVESHPSYWQVHRVGESVAALPTLRPTAFSPVADLDTLYERFVTLRIADALAAWAEVSLREHLQLRADGWGLCFPQGPLLTVKRGDLTVHLRAEPSYAYDGEGRVCRLRPGRPWRPDAVLEVLRHEHTVALHVLDAKHRRDPARAHDGGKPLAALADIWLRYGDGIGDRDTGLPLVQSVWMVWPGDAPLVDPQAPAMLLPGWPEDRLRGGSVSLRPRDPPQALRQLVAALLDSRQPR